MVPAKPKEERTETMTVMENFFLFALWVFLFFFVITFRGVKGQHFSEKRRIWKDEKYMSKNKQMAGDRKADRC